MVFFLERYIVYIERYTYILRCDYIPVPNMHCYSSGKLAPFQLAGKGLHRPYSAQVPTCTFVDAFLHCSNSLCITFAVVCRTFTIVTMLRPRVSSVESSSVASFIRVLHPLCNLRAHWRVFCMVLLWVITSYRAVVLLVTCTLCASYISTTVRYLWRNITGPSWWTGAWLLREATLVDSEIKLQSLSLITVILCLRLRQIVIHCSTWCY